MMKYFKKALIALLPIFFVGSVHAGLFDKVNTVLDNVERANNVIDRTEREAKRTADRVPLQKSSAQPSSRISGPEELEYNINRAGSDYRDFELKQADASLCQSACNSESRCKAWTYVNPGIQSKYAMCWLKDGVPEARSSTCCTSGIKSQGGYAQEKTGKTTYIAGNWSSDWGDMRFNQKKDRKTQVVDPAVSGSYSFDGKSRVYGIMDGNVLNGYWVQTSSIRDCGVSKHGSRYWGKIRFTFTENQFQGFLGYCDSEPDMNSKWDGRRK